MAIFSIINVWFMSFINPIFNFLFDERIASLFGGASLFSILFAFALIAIVLPILLHSSFSNFKGTPSKTNNNSNNEKGDK